MPTPHVMFLLIIFFILLLCILSFDCYWCLKNSSSLVAETAGRDIHHSKSAIAYNKYHNGIVLLRSVSSFLLFLYFSFFLYFFFSLLPSANGRTGARALGAVLNKSWMIKLNLISGAQRTNICVLRHPLAALL